jgi:pimeloyl-ACP methyl ester carboxylesterase
MELKTARGTLCYDHSGSGPLVVCLPGMGDNRTTYRLLTPLLVAAGHRVVTLDPRGQGESSAIWDDYSPEASGADLLELLHHLDAGPATLVVNSYTGASAVWAAAEQPAAFSELVLIGPFTRQMPTPNVVLRAVLTLLGRSRPLWLMYWSTLFKAGKPADFAAARARLSRQLAEPGRMAALRAQMAADKSVCEARMPAVTTTVRVVMGTKDPDFPDPRAEAALIAGRLRGDVVMIDGAGHYPQAESPRETADAILGIVVHRADRTGARAH